MSNVTPPHADLIEQARAYCEAAGISLSTFGHKTVNDGQFIARLLRGGRCWPETEAKVRDWIARNPAPPASQDAA